MMFPRKVSRNGAIISVLLLALISIQYTEAWTAMGYYKDDAYPGKCKIEDNLILSPGESAKVPGKCIQVSCVDEDGLVSLLGCGTIIPPDNCVLGDYVDVDAPYAECCMRKFICDDDIEKNDTMVAQKEENTLFELNDELNTVGIAENIAHKEL